MKLTKYQFQLSSQLERMLNSDEQVESINQDLKLSRRYLNVLVSRLYKELEDKTREDENLLDYDQPNWSLKQAERLGYRRALRKVIELMRPIEETND